MNAPVLQYVLQSAPPQQFRELDRVQLLRDMQTDEAATVPAGTSGTIVGVWSEGQAFEVEFSDFVGLVTAGVEEIERALG